MAGDAGRGRGSRERLLKRGTDVSATATDKRRMRLTAGTQPCPNPTCMADFHVVRGEAVSEEEARGLGLVGPFDAYSSSPEEEVGGWGLFHGEEFCFAAASLKELNEKLAEAMENPTVKAISN